MYSDAMWFDYCLPEEAERFGAESDDEDSAPVFAVKPKVDPRLGRCPKCGQNDSLDEADVDTSNGHGQLFCMKCEHEWNLNQIGQAGYPPKHPGHFMQAVREFAEFVCEGTDKSEFYLWDSAEEGWWHSRLVDGKWVEVTTCSTGTISPDDLDMPF